jgi:hypothetical protein
MTLNKCNGIILSCSFDGLFSGCWVFLNYLCYKGKEKPYKKVRNGLIDRYDRITVMFGRIKFEYIKNREV